MTPSPHILFGLILLFIAIFAVTGPLGATEPGSLDGNVYATVLNGENDTLTFSDGLFHSELSAGRGHEKGEYVTAAEGDEILFEATTNCSDEGEYSWTGVIQGNALIGSYLKPKKDGFYFVIPAKRGTLTEV